MINLFRALVYGITTVVFLLAFLYLGRWSYSMYRAKHPLVVNVETPKLVERIEKIEKKVAKYVFLFIGDGMGMAQRQAATYYLNDLKKSGESVNDLVMNSFPTLSMTTTHSQDSYITDSAAAGTAIATGHKTFSGVISMNSDNTQSYTSIATMAKSIGMKVGIVSSVSIDHATPACFYANTESRSNYYDIAVSLSQSGFDYFGGGGAKGDQEKYRNGRVSAVELAKDQGYSIVTTREELEAFQPDHGPLWAFNHTLDKNAALYYEMDRPNDHLSLEEFTRKGIELLHQPKGFFMMVEGGKIDWAAHANDTAAMIHEVIAFDRAIQTAVDFYHAHPDETLIVVTADHETGGLTLGQTRTSYQLFPRSLKHQPYSREILDMNVAEFRRQTMTLAEALPTLKNAMGLVTLEKSEMELLTRAYLLSMLPEKTRILNDEDKMIFGSHEPLSMACTMILNQRTGFDWTSFAHTALPVPTSALGVGHDRFQALHDNTDIYNNILMSMGQNIITELDAH